MRILVTGGAGFIGSNLSNTLVEQGHEVWVVDNLKNGYLKNLSEKVNFIEMDLTTIDLKDELKVKVDHIFHLVCSGLIESISDPNLDLETNAKTIINSLEFAKYCNASLIYTSSGAVHGEVSRSDLPIKEDSDLEPSNFYGATKLLAEHYCKIYSGVHNVKTLIFRLWNVYGYPQTINHDIGWIPVVTAFMTLENPKIFGDGKQTRDFTYVKDVVNGLIKGMNYLENNYEHTEIINLCGGKETSINELYAKCSNIIGRKIPPEHTTASLGDVRCYLASYEKAKSLLDWSPNSLDECLNDFYDELKNEGS